MADGGPGSDSASRRAQIIAGQALREAALPPTNWRAARKRRPFPSWTNHTPYRAQPPAEASAPAADPSDAPNAKK
jgi:hypothetical protein